MWINEDYAELESGIRKILGKEEYDPGVRYIRCQHKSDGYVYEETPLYSTLRCTSCGIHYDISPDGTEIRL